MPTNFASLIQSRQTEKFTLYEHYINAHKVRSARRTGFDKFYTHGDGCYLHDDSGNRYLDCDAGSGVFCLGRNHPRIREAVQALVNMNPPNMVLRDTPLIPALLAEALATRAPGKSNRVLFTNSGSETTEAALKFARRLTCRARLLFLEGGFHGVTYGALSVTDTGSGLERMGEGFGPMLPGCESIPREDLDHLEQQLSRRDVAALILEPIQGASVRTLSAHFLLAAQRLCRETGALFIVDEVFVGLGRTGKLFASEHFGLQPDMLLLSKALSGGCVPVGALVLRSELHDRAYDHIGAFVHGSTFGENDFGAAVGLATLNAIEEENLVDNAALQGEALLDGLNQLKSKYDMISDVRGRGLLAGMELRAPRRWGHRLAGNMLERRGLLGLMMMIQLMSNHRILSSTAGRNNIIRFHPPLTITQEDISYLLKSVESVIQDAYSFPGGVGRFVVAQLLKMARGA